MSSHDYHKGLPGYHPDQLLHDGCSECEARAKDSYSALLHLDLGRFRHAWNRAEQWQKHGSVDNLSRAETDMLRLLWAVQVQFERGGYTVHDGLLQIRLRALEDQIERLQRELTEAKVRSGELGVGALLATSPVHCEHGVLPGDTCAVCTGEISG